MIPILGDEFSHSKHKFPSSPKKEKSGNTNVSNIFVFKVYFERKFSVFEITF